MLWELQKQSQFNPVQGSFSSELAYYFECAALLTILNHGKLILELWGYFFHYPKS